MSARDGGGVRLVEVPVGVGGADDPVPAPRDHEQHRRLGAGDEAGLGADPVARHDEVDALAGLDVERSAAADHLLDLVGPDAGGVDHDPGPDLELAAGLEVDGRARRRPARPRAGTRSTRVRVATWAPWEAAVRATVSTRRASSTWQS